MKWRAGPVRAFILVSLLWPQSSGAFLPSAPLPDPDLVATTHRQITEEALEELSLELFGIPPTRAMRGAIAEIGAASAEVDRERAATAWHFDGENFTGSQTLLTAFQRAQVKEVLQRAEAGSARRHLGEALHVLQDFYAHSSWIEMGGGVHPDLGVPGSVIGGTAAAGEPTCQDCTPAPPPECADCSAQVSSPRLTSGYASGQDRPKPFAAKCSHGGPADATVMGMGLGINKDSADCLRSPHASLHAEAVAAAREATIEFVRDLAAELTARERRLLLGAGPTVALAVDFRGSCPRGCTGGVIHEQLRPTALSLFQSRLGTDEEPAKYVLVPYSKPLTAPTLATTDPQSFLTLFATMEHFGPGGPGCALPVMRAMLQALAAMEEGGILFLFDENSASDRELAASVAALAAARRIQVFPILFGNICNEPVEPGSVRAAEQSGGQLIGGIQLSDGHNAPKFVPLLDALVRRDLVRLLAVSGRLFQGPVSVPVPVDSTVRRVTFSISGIRGAALFRPDGSRVFEGQPGVVYSTHDAGDIYAVDDPQPGAWHVGLAGQDPFSLHVFGESPLDVSFRIVEAGGRPGHEGVFPIPGMPAAGRANEAVAVVSGRFDSLVFELRARDGSFLQTLPMTRGPGQGPGAFSGSVTLPAGPSLVYAMGTDAAGHPFQRLVPTPLEPQPVRIVPPPATIVPPGTTAISAFEVENVSGIPGTYRLLVVDERGLPQQGTPIDFALEGGESRVVAVPHVADGVGSTFTLTATVEGIDGTTGRNFAVVTHSAGLQADVTPPVIVSLAASPTELRPANRKLRTISLALEVEDDIDAAPACQITSVTSDEPAGDEADVVVGPGPLELRLRAERDKHGDGRVYTIEVTCTDAAGNSSADTAAVSVPRPGRD